MDYEMPIMNGLEAARAIRAKVAAGEVKDIPIAALTAYSDEKKACL